MPAPDLFDEQNLYRAISYKMSILFVQKKKKLKPPLAVARSVNVANMDGKRDRRARRSRATIRAIAFCEFLSRFRLRLGRCDQWWAARKGFPARPGGRALLLRAITFAEFLSRLWLGLARGNRWRLLLRGVLGRLFHRL